jgi:branched-chain amino acid aminotransferase
MKTKVLVSINGVVKEIDPREPIPSPPGHGLSPLDRGLLYGDGIMETLLVRQNQPILLRAHLDRLRDGADRMGLAIPWSDEEFKFEIEGLISQRAYPFGYLRILLTGGIAGGLWSSLREDAVPQRILYYGPYTFEGAVGSLMPRPPGSENSVQGGSEEIKGLKVRRKIAYHYSYQPRIKSNNYLHEVMALRQAAQEGFEEIIWTREDGEILEASTSNIFFMARQGDLLEIVTPPATSGILPGITRKKLISLLTHAGIPVSEQKIFFDEIPRFDEAFVTSSLAGLRPITWIDRQRFHTVRPQATFWHFKRLYQTWLETFRAE